MSTGMMTGMSDLSRGRFVDDEAAIAAAKQNDEDAMAYLLDKYRTMIFLKSRQYFIVGCDREDVIQEGNIGLYKAIRDFNAAKFHNFKIFADICITRQMITALKAATRQKHSPLNSALSLDAPLAESREAYTLSSALVSTDAQAEPEAYLVSKERHRELQANMRRNLSHFEGMVLEAYLSGLTYDQAANSLNRRVKSIDNAIQRIKRKIGKNLSRTEAA
jgi:RNA polymerase sporulation-specific sigma factor